MTAVEFFHDHVSKPLNGEYHSYNDCGMHWSTFDAEAARVEYRTELNRLLVDYGDGFELTPQGEVSRRSPVGLEPLLQAVPPTLPGKDYQDKVASAVMRFRSRSSSVEDRQVAVRDLADVLEYLRPQMKAVLTKKDDAALFEIANRFAIRHMDEYQFTAYDRPIWLSWMFYFYLATINAATRFIEARGSLQT